MPHSIIIQKNEESSVTRCVVSKEKNDKSIQERIRPPSNPLAGRMLTAANIKEDRMKKSVSKGKGSSIAPSAEAMFASGPEMLSIASCL